MAYKALYRTYRPQLFRDVVGQDAIVRMIQNAIANNKISHAYLLCGPRGTGKTTIARIFAKTLNCEAREGLEPCNKCISCNEISDSLSPDVIEIDAASNNGVDEIRNIRDKVSFLPSGAKYKVYIIDEVHMLTSGAFNALLKTLEEPPKHVVFILATTEPQKLPSTIISRCQRFDFKNVSISEMSKKLREVGSAEEIEITEEAINVISEAAEGGLRDALSILDQAISYAEGKVTVEEVNVVTGNLSSDKLIELTTKFEEKDVNAALEIIDELISMGKEVTKLVNGLLQFYRDLLLYKNVDSVMYSKYIFEKEAFQELAKNISLDKIYFYIDILSDVLAKVRYSANHRIYLETAIIKLINLSGEDLNFVKRIEKVEERLDNITLSPSGGGASVDHEKVDMMGMQLDHIVKEFNKLELYKLKDQIDDLQAKVYSKTGDVAGLDSEFINDIDKIKETVFILKTSYTGMVSRLVNLEEVTEQLENNLSSPNNKSVQASKVDLTNLTNDIKYMREDIDNLEEAVKVLYNKEVVTTNEGLETSFDDFSTVNRDIAAMQNKIKELDKALLNKDELSQDQKLSFDDEFSQEIAEIKTNIKDIEESIASLSSKPEVTSTPLNSSLEDKLNSIEKKLYAVISGELKEKKAPTVRQPKVAKEQIALFSNDLMPIENFKKPKTEEKTNFEQFAREEKLVENSKTSVESDPLEEIKLVKEIKAEVSNLLETVAPKEKVPSILESSSKETKAQGASDDVLSKKHDETEDNKEASQDEVKIIDGQEVLRHEVSEHSQLLITRKRTQEVSSEASFDATAKEKAPSEVKETIIDFNSNLKDVYSMYEIKTIEKIMNEAIKPEERNDFNRIKQIWEILDANVSPIDSEIARTLKNGKLTVAGNKEIILVYPDYLSCNRVMRPSFKHKALRILYDRLGDLYQYIALPEEVWSDIRRDFAGQYGMGIRPLLKPLSKEVLEKLRIKEDYQDPRKEIINKTVDFFGDELIEFE